MFGIDIVNEYYNIHLEIKIYIHIYLSVREILAALKRVSVRLCPSKLTFLSVT